MRFGAVLVLVFMLDGPRDGDASVERMMFSNEGREEEVGVEIWGMRRPLMEEERGVAIVDIVITPIVMKEGKDRNEFV